MAAVLCSGLGDICQNVFCLPCKACGYGCETCCQAISSPFFPYMVVTLALCVPPAVNGLVKAAANSCEGKWLFVNGALAVVHIAAAFYIVYKIQHDEAFDNDINNKSTTTTHTVTTKTTPGGGTTTTTVPTATTTSSLLPVQTGVRDVPAFDDPPKKKSTETVAVIPAATKVEEGTYYNASSPNKNPFTIERFPGDVKDRGSHNSFARIKHVMCYDKLVAVYIVVFVVWMIWQSIGVSNLVFEDHQVGCARLVATSVMCGFMYMGLVGMAFLCSLCCLSG